MPMGWMLDIETLERRIAAYDPAIATATQWREHIQLVCTLFRRRLHLLRVIAEASEN